MNKTKVLHYIKHDSSSGISLLEFLKILSLISLTLSVWIMPTYQKWLLQLELKLQAQQLLNTIQYARSIAIYQHKKIFLCKYKANLQDEQCWEAGWVILGEDPVSHTPSKLFVLL